MFKEIFIPSLCFVLLSMNTSPCGANTIPLPGDDWNFSCPNMTILDDEVVICESETNENYNRELLFCNYDDLFYERNKQTMIDEIENVGDYMKTIAERLSNDMQSIEECPPESGAITT